MIDPLLSLAFNLDSTKGGYALLLGSGVSRAAQVPTGWDIVLDLMRRLAHLQGMDPLPDPETWYRTTYAKEPDYSDLLDSIGGTEAERRQLLRSYFEPTDDERAQGIKAPTIAHRAIADLVTRGYIRAIVTTNFDRLQEQALEAQGIVPTVISTPDAADGALPLIHTPCTIVKVHGDYMDVRIKNTAAELAAYDPRIYALLDRIFDEFGLIVCGWSATWDPALRAALERCKSHRFTTYWAAVGPVTLEANHLIGLRRAQQLSIVGADHFFQDVAEKVHALEDLRQPHPLTAQVAATTLKRCLEDGRLIRAHDLLIEESTRLRARTSDDHFPIINVAVTAEEMRKRLRQYENVAETAQALVTVSGYWGEPSYEWTWRQCIEKMAESPINRGGTLVWLRLGLYPALLLLYTGGLAATIAEKYDNLAALLVRGKTWHLGSERPLIMAVNSYEVMDRDLVRQWLSPAGPRAYTPVSDYLHGIMRKSFKDYVLQDEQYDMLFDRFELLAGLAHADIAERLGLNAAGPIGRFSWRSRHAGLTGAASTDVMSTLRDEATAAGDQWAPLLAGFFGGSIDRFNAIFAAYTDFVNKATFGWI